ncbi:unnamed protein product [Cuscuta europaea]|uniref:Uncharacterized protein n=1 Tax=Cuscuta europaea TaxID=41803 RepID=A0A9P0ZPR6_CUSEU|nr:unnamed protein product [Cuscuta europaea]
MDPEALAASTAAAKTTRKVRFAPKGPPRRAQKLVLPKPEKVEDDIDGVKAEELLRRFNESTSFRTTKADKKGSIQFVSGDSSKSYGSHLRPKGADKSSNGVIPGQEPEKEYKEPWDYYSYYPISLPLRRPYSGNPEVLDEQEFGSQNSNYNESSTNSAAELGLFEEDGEDNMFFFQLPLLLPTIKQHANASEGSEAANNNPKASKAGLCKLDDLNGGFLGKMLVYKSGAIKMKLGETLYDVSPGTDCIFSQNAVAMNLEEKYCCNIGELNKRAIVTPDIDFILGSMPDL